MNMHLCHSWHTAPDIQINTEKAHLRSAYPWRVLEDLAHEYNMLTGIPKFPEFYPLDGTCPPFLIKTAGE